MEKLTRRTYYEVSLNLPPDDMGFYIASEADKYIAVLEARVKELGETLFSAQQALLTEGQARNQAEAVLAASREREEKVEDMLREAAELFDDEPNDESSRVEQREWETKYWKWRGETDAILAEHDGEKGEGARLVEGSDGEWECSACHNDFCFIDSGPKENRYTYCSYCGAKITEYVEYKDPTEEGTDAE